MLNKQHNGINFVETPDGAISLIYRGAFLAEYPNELAAKAAIDAGEFTAVVAELDRVEARRARALAARKIGSQRNKGGK